MNAHRINASSISHTPVFTPSSQAELARAIAECVEVDEECVKGPKGPIGSWAVSGVTDMSAVFSSQESFKGDISAWDVSSVTNMDSMFEGASSFNQDISKWDVSKLIHARAMFNGASSFNQNISKWDVSRVTDMHSMFFGASSFRQTLCGAWIESKARKFNMFKDSRGRIGKGKACPGTEKTKTTFKPRFTTFKPSSKRKLADAIGDCVNSAIDLTQD